VSGFDQPGVHERTQRVDQKILPNIRATEGHIMELNAQQALSNLERATKAYLYAKDDRSEATITLERAIARGDIEAANLGRTMGDSYEQRQLYQQLIFQVEMAKGTLAQAQGRRRS
jgi:hypothetical protein